MENKYQALVSLYYSLRSQYKIKQARHNRIRNYADSSQAAELALEMVAIDEQIKGIQGMPVIMQLVGRVPEWL